MSTFELFILILFAIFVLVNIYLGISGRILNRKQTKIDNERLDKQSDWEEQIKALSLKVYEFQSENLKLTNEMKDCIKKYNQLSSIRNTIQKERDELKIELESLKNTSKEKVENE